MPRKPPKSPEQRLARWSRSMAPGTMNGRVASATPMALDRTQLAPRMRAQPITPVVGFDPNENPVIIGAGATAGGGSSPSNTSGGTASTVAVGAGAEASTLNDTAVGANALATGGASTAIGPSAEAQTALSIAIGRNTSAGTGGGGGVGAVAVGSDAIAHGDNSLALGGTASIGLTHTQSTAIGYAATTTKAHQIMLGTVSTFVEIPGDSSTAPNGWVQTDTVTGTRYIVQITSGALVLSAAP